MEVGQEQKREETTSHWTKEPTSVGDTRQEHWSDEKTVTSHLQHFSCFTKVFTALALLFSIRGYIAYSVHT